VVDGKKSIRILLVEDDDFSRTLVKELLDSLGLLVFTASSVSEALKEIEEFDPHVVMTDLDLGMGPDGADLLTRVVQERPWTGMVVMTAHSSPHLAVSDVSRIPSSAVYLVKSQISSKERLLEVVYESIENSDSQTEYQVDAEGKATITSNQAEILKMLSEGLSNSAIAESRGITLRAAEALIQRTFAALGVNNDSNINPRVAAVKMWHQGKVVVR
jgi:DNA-binding NarL/FixJ family response regulator